MRIADLDTPAVLIDLEVMERNLRRAAEYSGEHGLRLRPHTKTHKIPELARRQLELGAAGLTVAKVGEAEVMLAAEPEDLLIAYPVVGGQKLARVCELARRTRVTVALDSLTAADGLSAAARAGQVEIGVLAEVDAGAGRVGVRPGAELTDLIRGIVQLPALRYEGIAFFMGHIGHMDEAGIRAMAELQQMLTSLLSGLRREGLEARIVSGGSTSALYHSHCVPAMNEIRSGTYLFNDRNTVARLGCSVEDCAVTVLTTVVSNAKQGQVIIDAGSKTFSSDPFCGPEGGFGEVVDAPGALLAKMNEEHGYVDVQRTGRSFAVGERLRVIPNHVCPTVNLHDVVYGIVGDEVRATWEVKGRGRVQ